MGSPALRQQRPAHEAAGIEWKHQDGLNELTRHFVQTQEGVTLQAKLEHRVEQQRETVRW